MHMVTNLGLYPSIRDVGHLSSPGRSGDNCTMSGEGRGAHGSGMWTGRERKEETGKVDQSGRPINHEISSLHSSGFFLSTFSSFTPEQTQKKHIKIT